MERAAVLTSEENGEKAKTSTEPFVRTQQDFQRPLPFMPTPTSLFYGDDHLLIIHVNYLTAHLLDESYELR
jgi:hypothetical protein